MLTDLDLYLLAYKMSFLGDIDTYRVVFSLNITQLHTQKNNGAKKTCDSKTIDGCCRVTWTNSIDDVSITTVVCHLELIQEGKENIIK